ncbi:hypothetical protein PF003_g15856 [Phytophthora fragariae]|nr:hypothetical protein PF003_g15856 [Phytophthora fragariae]
MDPRRRTDHLRIAGNSRLIGETSSESYDAFLPQLELWTSLPDNEHILKLYGASYESKPQFYVCENAHNGNLAEFLEDEKRSGLYWQLFHTVRTLSAGLSQMAGQANTKSVRWKPKEVLEETGTEAVRYESDIYSLAMCMIETKTHEIRPTR